MSTYNETEAIAQAQEAFGKVLAEELKRVERIKLNSEPTNFSALPCIAIGVVGGDGIGPAITQAAQNVLEFLLKEAIASGKVAIRVIEGLTIERRAALQKAIPDDVLAELKGLPCHTEGAHHHARARRSLAQCGKCQCGYAKGTRPFCQRAACARARSGDRLDVLPRKHRRRLLGGQ